ncbi:hypothetical protein O9G_005838 [Rozella allomycis CSF55]|uniref:Uncharacterized protein n=1 Tax=Rozella allomycis (strain CSF55) TaxID=988480 RepID=A0A075AV37_ROZAC|nr:hypothetical protein O9G_005838 [Rozella allomycis CSF55]|eukprot:EPZ34161.1 hypothetical protein O9G_005838 [Rozella allomycis CSF55]
MIKLGVLGTLVAGLSSVPFVSAKDQPAQEEVKLASSVDIDILPDPAVFVPPVALHNPDPVPDFKAVISGQNLSYDEPPTQAKPFIAINNDVGASSEIEGDPSTNGHLKSNLVKKLTSIKDATLKEMIRVMLEPVAYSLNIDELFIKEFKAMKTSDQKKRLSEMLSEANEEDVERVWQILNDDSMRLRVKEYLIKDAGPKFNGSFVLSQSFFLFIAALVANVRFPGQSQATTNTCRNIIFAILPVYLFSLVVDMPYQMLGQKKLVTNVRNNPYFDVQEAISTGNVAGKEVSFHEKNNGIAVVFADNSLANAAGATRTSVNKVIAKKPAVVTINTKSPSCSFAKDNTNVSLSIINDFQIHNQNYEERNAILTHNILREKTTKIDNNGITVTVADSATANARVSTSDTQSPCSLAKDSTSVLLISALSLEQFNNSLPDFAKISSDLSKIDKTELRKINDAVADALNVEPAVPSNIASTWSHYRNIIEKSTPVITQKFMESLQFLGDKNISWDYLVASVSFLAAHYLSLFNYTISGDKVEESNDSNVKQPDIQSELAAKPVTKDLKEDKAKSEVAESATDNHFEITKPEKITNVERSVYKLEPVNGDNSKANVMYEESEDQGNRNAIVVIPVVLGILGAIGIGAFAYQRHKGRKHTYFGP